MSVRLRADGSLGQARAVEWIAHRAGNDAATAAVAVPPADAIEVDVHLLHRRLEVRHARVLWPFRRQFEPWYLLPVDAPRPPLHEIVDAVADDVPLWYDLKGFTPRLARQILELDRSAAAGGRPITLSCRSWWVLRPARRRAGVRTMKSVNNRIARWLVTSTPLGRADTGVVINQRLLDAGAVGRLRRRASTIVTWGVDDVDRARALIDLGVDGLIIDDLELIAAVESD